MAMIQENLNSLHEPVVAFDDARFIAFETDEETFLLPYISLRMVRYRDLNRREEEGLIELTFDGALVQIHGNRVKQILPEIQQERLFSIRVGIEEQLSAPQVKKVEVLLSEG